MYSWFCAEFDCPGSPGSERGEGEAIPGAAAGGHHQWGGAAGRLLMHTRLTPRAHHRRVQCHPAGPAGTAGRVPALREYRETLSNETRGR